MKKPISQILMWLYTISMVGLAIVGSWRLYTPVPYSDMWHGFVNLYLNMASADASVYWAQANEHRNIWSRLLFHADFILFNGDGWFLVVVIYIFMGIAAATMAQILRRSTCGNLTVDYQKKYALFLVGAIFFWCQSENLTIGYQIHFILAFLLPLLALYAAQMSVRENKVGYYLASIFLGVASVGTLANGLLVLPLLTLFNIFTKQTKFRVSVLFLITGCVFFLYFQGYQNPAHHSNLSWAVTAYPVELIKYIFLFLGSPFYYIFGGWLESYVPGIWEYSRGLAILAGFILVADVARIVVNLVRSKMSDVLQLALVLFIIFIIASAVATAGGRLIFGVDQALASRYTTPAVFAWLIWVVIRVAPIAAAMKNNILFAFGASTILVLMVVYQLQALYLGAAELFDKENALLALELQVKDEMLIRNIYQFPKDVYPIANQASSRHFSAFGKYPYKNLKQKIGVQAQVPEGCEVFADTHYLLSIKNEPNFRKIAGHFWGGIVGEIPKGVFVLNGESRIVGYVLTQSYDAMSGEFDRAFWQGYVATATSREKLRFLADTVVCYQPSTHAF